MDLVTGYLALELLALVSQRSWYSQTSWQLGTGPREPKREPQAGVEVAVDLVSPDGEGRPL